mgnify:FL=1
MTVVIRMITEGSLNTISAFGDKSSCELFEFFEEQRKVRLGEMKRLYRLFARTADKGVPNNNELVRFFNKEGIFEFKTRGGLRVFAFWDKGRLIICTNGFVKKKQKTPRREIKKAVACKKAYFKAKDDDDIIYE